MACAVLALSLAACGGSGDPGDPDPSAGATSGSATSPESAASGSAEAPASTIPYGSDASGVYDAPEAWICRPDLADDDCRDLDVTRLDPSGGRSIERRSPAEDPPIDCFYVYPTTSADQGTNSDMTVGPDDSERQTVAAQAAQYSRSCRVFAPIYRQVTLAALFDGRFQDGTELAYGDVLDAWKSYVSRFSDGRGVIVIGHSQGASILRRLVAEEIDPVPDLRARLVSAHLLGTSVQVPEGELVGGSFQEIPGCSRADETGCVVSWSSYAGGSPPPVDALFGRSEQKGTRALCTDAVALLGRGAGSAVAPSAGRGGGIEGLGEVRTRFVSLPEVVEVSCVTRGDFDYLSVAVANPQDPRPVAALQAEPLGPTWGLHILDMSLAQDDLVELAARQGAAYSR